MNTIERHKDQITKAVTFLAKAKFTSAKHLQMVAGRNRRGFPTQLKKLGLVVSREIVRGQHIFGLSKRGADLAGVPQFDIHKVGISRVEHALIGQFETLDSIEQFGITDYEFEPQSCNKETRPDVVWTSINASCTRKYYIEIELSGKSISDGDMDRFFLKLISRRTIVVFTDTALFGRYLRHALKYAKEGIPDWKLQDGMWFRTGGVVQVDRTAWDHVFFRQHGCAGIMSINEFIDEGLIG